MFKKLKFKLVLIIFTLSLFFFIERNVLAFVEYQTNPIYNPNNYADSTIVVTSTGSDWWFFQETPTGSGAFVDGPSLPTLGGGSAQLTVNGTGGEIFGTFAFVGTRLDTITSLAYSTYRSSGSSALAPSLQLDIDTDVTDANTAWQGRLVYEPYYTNTVSTGVWQTWNPLDNAGTGNWWFTGAPGNSTCPLNNPCTWSELKTAFPNAGIRSAGSSTGALQFKAGGGWTSGFVGSVDAFSIGVNNVVTTYDFERVINVKKAYFPSVLKMGASDYRMWYQSNSRPSNTTVAYATSADGLSWTPVTSAVSGLIAENAGHPHVEFADGKFRIWYWNAVTPYGNTAMHYAESVDGINWTNDSAITGNLISATSGLWNSGSYGAVDVIINDSPTNSGTNPFDYKYAMYYDATSGGYEQIALGYSADGIAWTLYGTGPVLVKGLSGSWDSGYAVFGTVIKDDFYRMWYSGGVSASNEGIGCATSIDGLVWAKCPSNPLMSKNDGVAWRNNRTYTPSVIKDGSDYKMWFTGRDTATSNYTVGYATLTQSEAGHLYLPETSNGGVSMPADASNITLNNDSVLNVASNANVASGGNIIIAGVTTALSNFTSGNLTGVDLSTPKNIGGQSVTVGMAVQISSGVNAVPTILTNLSLGNTSVSIPDDTTILAPSGWNGIILPPKVGSSLGDTPPSGFSVGSTVIEVGSTSTVLLFDKPVQVILNGLTGSVGYKPSGLTTWTKITATCGGTYDAPTLSTSSFPGECSITNGVNTKILTYHFTTFGGLDPLIGTLTYTAGANGSITGTSPQTVNYGSDGSAVTAVPNTGYHFVNWSDASTANPRTETNVNADISVTANFAIDESGSGGGGGGGSGIIVDNAPPEKPILNSLITQTKEKLVNISGLAEPRSRIDLYDKGVLVGRLYSAVDNNGIFAQNFQFGVGRHSLTVQAVDFSNNISPFSDPVIFDIVASVPTAPIILTPQNGISITNETPQIIGVADVNNQIIITVDNNQFTVNSDNKGAWNFTLPDVFALSDGRHVISVIAKDITNKQSPATTVAITKITAPVPLFPETSIKTISVPSTPGVGVIPVPSALNGRVVSVTPPSLINSTTQAVELPGIPMPKVITAGVKVQDVLSFTGTSMPNSDVVIYIHSDQSLVYYARTDQAGNWTINHSQIISELAPGDHTIYAIALDPNNKVKSQPSAVSGFTVQRDFWVTIYKYLNWQTTAVALVFSVLTMLWLYRLRVKQGVEV